MCLKVRCEWATKDSQVDIQCHDTKCGVPINIVLTHYASYAKLEQGITTGVVVITTLLFAAMFRR
jgi:hypothetical protein